MVWSLNIFVPSLHMTHNLQECAFVSTSFLLLFTKPYAVHAFYRVLLVIILILVTRKKNRF